MSSLALVAALALAAPVAEATVMVRLSRAELIDRAELVVRCVVEGQGARWNEDGTRIITLSRLRVLAYLKGQGPAGVVLRQFGGTVGGDTLQVPGDARLTRGGEYVLFLRRGAGDVVYLTAMSQSAFAVGRDAQGAVTVQRSFEDVTFAVPQGDRMVYVEAGDEPPEPLYRLLDAVSQRARGAR
ncbi:MAG: hypothetical protein HY909_18490 [Deltaproteobacteria bacterium]|nr:hypothetical protein [Deltaproteobacteria bacterium]